MAKDALFDLFLQSNASMDTYPSNTISSFTNNFGASIKQGEWGVALRTIGYQKTWLNVRKRVGVRITIAVHVVRKACYVERIVFVGHGFIKRNKLTN